MNLAIFLHSEETILRSNKKIDRLVVVDEDYDLCSFSDEIAAFAAEKRPPLSQSATSHVVTPNFPIPYSPVLERHVPPSKENVRAIYGFLG
ncbi:MAG: hypothetical protein JSV18_00380 [Candidatus Bathyarchaeota archaeon]|nr:MAG: hypothetical protein JSV18_00380 [Candidatus Bathyarchaeota archaeon]